MLKFLRGCMSKLFGSSDTLDLVILRELRQLRRDQHEDTRLLAENQRAIYEVLVRIEKALSPRLSSLLIRLEGGTMAGTVEVGKQIKATVLGFDQNGQAFDLTGQAVSWSVDNAAIATAAPADQNPTEVTGVAPGTANLSVAVGSLTAMDQVTVTAPAPVLTSLQISFS